MMKGQKGITLVALIITIIVMLILVGVSITVAMNGGLFDKATTAREGTLKSQVTEAMTLAKAEVLSDFYEGKITTAPTEAGLKGKIEGYLDGITVSVSTTDNLTYTVTATDKNNAAIDLGTDNTIVFSVTWTTPAP